MNPRTPDVHPTALVHPGAILESGTRVAPYAIVEEDTVIGAGCDIGAHAVIKRFTRMGKENRIHEGVVLGGTPQDLSFQSIRSFLRIGTGNVFREQVTIHRATTPDGSTLIGDSNYLMAYAHVGHDSTLEDHIVIACHVAVAGFVHIEDHVFISGGSVIHQFTRLGRYGMIGGLTKVVQDTLPFFVADGVPARTRGLNLVGLKRGGYKGEEISDLKKAYKSLLLVRCSLGERLKTLREIDSPHVRHLVSFVEKSRRGFCTTPRKNK